jgi:hypothetical protein
VIGVTFQLHQSNGRRDTNEKVGAFHAYDECRAKYQENTLSGYGDTDEKELRTRLKFPPLQCDFNQTSSVCSDCAFSALYKVSVRSSQWRARHRRRTLVST